MKHVLFLKEEEKLRYIVFDGIIKTIPRVVGDKLVVKVHKFKLVTEKDISYSNEAGWIAIPVKGALGGLINIADEDDPEEEIKEAIKHEEDAMLKVIVAHLLGIIWWMSSVMQNWVLWQCHGTFLYIKNFHFLIKIKNWLPMKSAFCYTKFFLVSISHY